MGRPPALAANEKADIVLSVLSGKATLAEAARRAGVSEQAVGNWKRQFVLAGSQGLSGRTDASSERERKLRSEVTELKLALGEVYAQLRARHRAAEGQLVPADVQRRFGANANPTFRGTPRHPGHPGRGVHSSR